jgi:Endoribonuclease L-PSP
MKKSNSNPARARRDRSLFASHRSWRHDLLFRTIRPRSEHRWVGRRRCRGRDAPRVGESDCEVLRVAGLSLKDVVDTTIFVADLRDFDVVNRIYGEHFNEPYPARSTVQAGG